MQHFKFTLKHFGTSPSNDVFSLVFKYNQLHQRRNERKHERIDKTKVSIYYPINDRHTAFHDTVMCIGTIALILANHTSLFRILGTPFVPLLEILKVEDAVAASSTLIVGFADMFTPSVIIAGAGHLAWHLFQLRVSCYCKGIVSKARKPSPHFPPLSAPLRSDQDP